MNRKQRWFLKKEKKGITKLNYMVCSIVVCCFVLLFLQLLLLLLFVLNRQACEKIKIIENYSLIGLGNYSKVAMNNNEGQG